ncbi:hypothetical protein JVU11DRAFT_10764 [Chiua virens]|nr:hypothetical protein JVU11DRAFT_10764 [Chiua virens]
MSSESFGTEDKDHGNSEQQYHEELRMGGTLRRVFHPHLNSNLILIHAIKYWF